MEIWVVIFAFLAIYSIVHYLRKPERNGQKPPQQSYSEPYQPVSPKPAEHEPQNKTYAEIFPPRFIVLDIETTGLNPQHNKIIEIAAIRIEIDKSEHDSKSTLIKIKGAVPDRITAMTGITTEMLKADGEPIEEALPEYLAFFEDLPIVAFNAEFDLGFLRHAAAGIGLTISNPVICALEMARAAWPDRSSHRLSSIAEDFGFQAQDHRALGDALLAAKVYVQAARHLGRHMP